MLEATCKAIYYCNETQRSIVGLSNEEVAEVKSVFGSKLIPKS